MFCFKGFGGSPGALRRGIWRAMFGRQIVFSSCVGHDPAALTQQMKETITIHGLLCIHFAHESRLGHIELSACWG